MSVHNRASINDLIAANPGAKIGKSELAGDPSFICE